MGIYDREYYREEEHSGFFAARAMVINLILINAAVWIAQLIVDQPFDPFDLARQPDPHRQPLLYWLSLDAEFFRHPWQLWRLLSYGFLHADFWHIAFNMFGLWLFGRDVEGVYGRVEFVRIYLTAIIVAGAAWLLGVAVSHSGGDVIGASGGVMGIMILYVLHYPRRTFYMFPIPLPIPAWALGVFYVAGDLVGLGGALGRGDNVAHVAHLGGVAFGYVYFRTGWNLGRLVPRSWSLSSLKLRPKLRIHDPTTDDRNLTGEVDRILEKISREGESSLTKQERAILEKASRRYQQRRR
jgi:membrane associated rhomboid family serine protease